MGGESKAKQVQAYSVTEITEHIKDLLESDQKLINMWVKGEISNLSSGRHMYFSLKDENSILKCAMFSGKNSSLKFTPKDGMEVIARGSIDVYKPRGTYQLIVEELQPTGPGALYLKFIQLKEKLLKEGLFEDRHKKPIPKYPKTIGIVTSPVGAVIRDIVHTIKTKFPIPEMILAPCLVQGEKAASEIVSGIKILNKLKVDVIIIARGGGSLEDLWSFNEESVARAIFNSKVPIISGIGHKVDFTIAGFVADVDASTPTAAAEISVPNRQELYQQLINLKRRLTRFLFHLIVVNKTKLKGFSESRVIRKPFERINEFKQLLGDKTIILAKNMIMSMRFYKHKIEILDVKLISLDPYAILERGYSVTLRDKDNTIIKDVRKIKEDEVIHTLISKGKIKSRILELKQNET